MRGGTLRVVRQPSYKQANLVKVKAQECAEVEVETHARVRAREHLSNICKIVVQQDRAMGEDLARLARYMAARLQEAVLSRVVYWRLLVFGEAPTSCFC